MARRKKSDIPENETLAAQMEESPQENGKKKTRSDKNGVKDKKKRPVPSQMEEIEHSSIYYFHTFLLFGGRLLNKVLDAYNSLFELNSKDKIKVYRNISNYYNKKGTPEKALDYYRGWVRADPNNPEPLFQMGIALTMSGNNKSALEAFNRTLARDPDHLGALYRKSALHLRLHEYEPAIEGLRYVIDHTPENARTFYLLGIAYEAVGQMDQAKESMQTAARLNPQEIKYHQHLGFMSVRQEDHKTAAEHFSKVMNLERELDEGDEV